MVTLRSGFRRSQELAWLLTGPVGLFAVLVTLFLGIKEPEPSGSWLLGLVFLGLLIAADRVVLMFEVRRQAFTVTLVEIPVLLALFWLPPMTVVLARVLASILAQASRRVPPIKLWFNVASHAAAVSLAGLIVFAFNPEHLRGEGDAGPYEWVSLGAAVMAGVLFTLAVTVGVVTLVQGRISTHDLIRIATPGLIVAGINITIGLVTLALLQNGPWAVVLLAALAAFFVIAYRSYAQFLRQHRTLSEIYDLTRAIADTPHDGTLTDVLLHRVRRLLQAEYATLWLPPLGRYPEVLLSARVDDSGLVDLAGLGEAVRRRVLATGETVAIGPKLGGEKLRGELRVTGAKDAIVVPLRAGSAVIGCIEVTNRLGDLATFGPSDVRLLETLAAHAAVAVENSRLVDRLRYDAYHDASHRPAQPPARHCRDRGVGQRPRARRGGRGAAVRRRRPAPASTSRSATAPATRCSPRWPAGCGRSRRPAALVGRLGSDEFAVTLRVDNAEGADSSPTTMRDQIRRPDGLRHAHPRRRRPRSASPCTPTTATTPRPLLQRADVAAHAAKTVPGSVQLFNAGPGVALGAPARRSPPTCAGRSTTTRSRSTSSRRSPLTDRRLVGVECLARWEHPAHGAVPPEDFVAVAEHTGQLARS